MTDQEHLALYNYKQDFPLLMDYPHLTYLDSAATSQRPRSVLDAQRWFQENLNANPLRGVYSLSVEATDKLEEARKAVAQFIHAPHTEDIIFTRNTTESLNLLALRYAPEILQQGDEVCITIMEHHSNLIPWQLACKRAGAKLVYMYPDKQGYLSKEEIDAKIGPRTRIVSVTHVSNVFGIENPVKYIVNRAHSQGAVCFIDAAQSIPHLPINVMELGCDALAFSGHKVFSPTGIGVLWATSKLLDEMPPLLTGGEMIEVVTEQDAFWAGTPYKFEAGTQDSAGIYSLQAALNYVNAIGHDTLRKREHALVQECMDRMKELPYIEIYGPEKAEDHIGVISFNIKGIHPHDVSAILDSHGVCIRAGHHCAEPLMAWLGIGSCCRASFAIYNDSSDIDTFITALKQVWEIFHGSN